MPEPVDRFKFAGAEVQSQAMVIDGTPLFFIDIHADRDDQCVTVGWSADRTRFGVYVNGLPVTTIILPEPEQAPDPIDPDDLITDDIRLSKEP
jgi:hypothetical protein